MEADPFKSKFHFKAVVKHAALNQILVVKVLFLYSLGKLSAQRDGWIP